jgi:hypothetical protein
MVRYKKTSGFKSMGDNQLVFSLVLGAIGGIAVSHIFKTQVNTLWNDIPYLKNIKGGD